jgi:hypothetical protein
MSTATQPLPAHVVEVQDQMTVAAMRLEGSGDAYEWADLAIAALAKRLENPDPRIFEAAYVLLTLESRGSNVDEQNEMMVDLAGLICNLSTVIALAGDGSEPRKAHHYLDAIQQRLVRLGSEIAKAD